MNKETVLDVKKNDGCAPIVLFVYNRPDHTRKTIEALQKNKLAEQSDLYIYSDAPRNEKAVEPVRAVRKYLESVAAFKKIEIIKRERNWGLANSIIDGVSSVINQYGRVIVLEDDIVTSPYFLSIMNQALDRYEQNSCVWHISGWSYPIEIEGLPQAFFWRVMNCWGWATWADRWKHFEKKPEKLIKSWKREKIHRFNLDGYHNFWSQITSNYNGKLNTWAIFWYATIFEHGGLCLNPSNSYVQNIGSDGSGENCEATDAFKTEFAVTEQIIYPEEYKENQQVVDRIKNFYKSIRPSLFIRMASKIKRTIFS